MEQIEGGTSQQLLVGSGVAWRVVRDSVGPDVRLAWQRLSEASTNDNRIA